VSEGIEFDLDVPIWQVEFYHNTPNTAGYWTMAFQSHDDENAIAQAIVEYRKHGLEFSRVYAIKTWKLESLKGGSNG
jgi:hypothetical protein